MSDTDDPIDRRLREWAEAERRAAPPVRLPRERFGTRRRRPRRPLAVATSILAVAAVVVVVAVLSAHLGGHSAAPPAIAPSSSAPTAPASGSASASASAGPITGLADGTTFLVRTYPSAGRPISLQLRAVSDGQLIRTVWTSTGAVTEISAAVEPDGSILVAQTDQCHATLQRIDHDTGRAQTLRTLAEPVSDLIVDHSDTRIAYVTQPTCTPDNCPSVCAGRAMFNPSTLVVLDLGTGRTSRTSTDSPGHPLGALAWSPDGTRIAATYLGDTTKLLVFDAAAPKFTAARPVSARAGCVYTSTAWTSSGLLAGEYCGPLIGLSPDRLVEITSGGQVLASWSLPACTASLGAATTPAAVLTLVQLSIGYGNGACDTAQASGTNPLTRITAIGGSQLRTILQVRAAEYVALVAY